VYSDTKVPFLGEGNHSGKHWSLEAFNVKVTQTDKTAEVVRRSEMVGRSVTGASTVPETTGTPCGLQSAAVMWAAVGGVPGLLLIVLIVGGLGWLGKMRKEGKAGRVWHGAGEGKEFSDDESVVEKETA